MRMAFSLNCEEAAGGGKECGFSARVPQKITAKAHDDASCTTVCHAHALCASGRVAISLWCQERQGRPAVQLVAPAQLQGPFLIPPAPSQLGNGPTEAARREDCVHHSLPRSDPAACLVTPPVDAPRPPKDE